MATKKHTNKKPIKKRKHLGVIGGVNERDLQRISNQVKTVEHAITTITESMKSTKDRGIKASKKLMLSIRKKQLKVLMRDLKKVSH